MSQPGPYFPFYAQDWLGDHKVRGLSPAARGTYIDILALMWTSSDGGLSATPEKLSRMVGQSVEEFILSWAEIQDTADPILEERAGRVFSRRMMREREKYAEKRAKLREAGRKGGEAKARNYGDSLANASEMLKQKASSSSSSTESSSRSSSSTESKEGTTFGPYPAARGDEPPPQGKPSKLYYNISSNGSHPEYMERVKAVFSRLLEERGTIWAGEYPNYGGPTGIRAEMYRAYEWIEAHPEKRKQRLLVFISGWIGRNHDNAGSGSRASPLSKGERGVRGAAEWLRRQQESEHDPTATDE